MPTSSPPLRATACFEGGNALSDFRTRALLAQLQASEAPLARALDPQAAASLDIGFVQYDEAAFRFALNQDAMATEKLVEGIRAFVADTLKLEAMMG